MERTKGAQTYWFIGYLIPFNKPQRRYGNFKMLEDITNDESLQPQPNDYIFRHSKVGPDYIYYRFSGKHQKWIRQMEILEYRQNIKQENLYFIQ